MKTSGSVHRQNPACIMKGVFSTLRKLSLAGCTTIVNVVAAFSSLGVKGQGVGIRQRGFCFQGCSQLSQVSPLLISMATVPCIRSCSSFLILPLKLLAYSETLMYTYAQSSSYDTLGVDLRPVSNRGNTKPFTTRSSCYFYLAPDDIS